MSSSNLNSKLEGILVESNKLDENEAKRNCQAMEEFSGALVYSLKRANPIFSELFETKSFSGSYFEGLRVKKADQFHLNLVFRFPFNEQQVQIVRDVPGTAQFRVIGNVDEILRAFPQKWKGEMNPRLRRIFYQSGKLSQIEFRRWFQECLVEAVESEWFVKPSSITNEIYLKTDAVATFTYQIHTKGGQEIEISVKPVVSGACYSFSKGVHGFTTSCEMQAEHQELYLVMQPPTREDDVRGDQNWQVDFSVSERQMLQVGGCFKNLIRLCKLLRDKNQWKISSFQIKHLFLLEIRSRPYWPDNDLGELFVALLRKWQAAIQRQHLPFYFDRSHNLFKSLNQQEAKQIANKMGDIISAVQRNPANISRYL